MRKRYSRTHLTASFLLATATLAATCGQALANPNGGAVVAGQATIAQTAPAQVTITQSTDKAIINWNSFSIGTGEQTRFVQPSSNSITLNRVTGPDVSQIFGQLTANGRIVLVNPNGVFFGKDSQVDVAALIATSHDIKNDDFMAGRLNFTIPGRPGAQIINQGKITVQEGGLVALVAPSVQNSGLITARLGKVVLASANTFTIDLYGDNLILFEADSAITSQLKDALGNPLAAAVENSGTIEANGGWVLLTAEVAKNVVDKAINMTGLVKATTVDQQAGTIILKAMGGEVTVAGTLDASAPNGGDGGFIETSGAHVTIDPAARITTVAPRGMTGRWLIDPTDYTIAASGGDITGADLATYLGASNVEIQTLATGSSGQGYIYVDDAVTWDNFNELTLTAYRNINVTAAINATGGGSVKLRADSLGTGTGTVLFGGSTFTGLTGHITVNNGAAVGIYYNPISYTDAATKSDGSHNPYSSNITLNSGSYMKAYMLVNNVDQLQAINTNLAGNYALGKNIDASATAGWNNGAGFSPIMNWTSNSQYSPFTGSLDGQYYTISSLTINRPGEDHVGLFGITAGSSISNVGLVNCSVSGNNFVGGLLGLGQQLNSSRTTISNSYVTGSVSGGSAVGGLVGRNVSGTISNSYATANVNGASEVGGLAGGISGGTISNSYATGSAGSVSGGGTVGGLVGWNNGTVNNSYATGSVSGGTVGGLVGSNSGTVNNSYATGSVSGGTVGGLVGDNGYGMGTVSNSFWDTTTSGWASSNLVWDPGTSSWVSSSGGLTTDQMKQQASYSGWDFTNTWQIVEGVSRPTLKVARVASAQSATVLTPTGNAPPPANPFLGLDANALYAAVISDNLATSYSTDANWLALKTGNGGNATQAQIDANIMLNAYNRYKAYSGQALADKLYQDVVINHYSYGGTTITNDSANLLWKGSCGSSLVAGTGQVNANIMLQSFNYYSTTDKRSGYSLFADILRGSVTLPGVGTQTITNSSDNLVWRGIYGWSSSHTGATEVQIAVNDMKNTRDSYYNRMDKVQELYEVVNAGTTIATNPNFGNRYNNWLALSDGWENGSANLTMSSVQRAVKAKLLLAADAAADAAVQGNNVAQTTILDPNAWWKTEMLSDDGQKGPFIQTELEQKNSNLFKLELQNSNLPIGGHKKISISEPLGSTRNLLAEMNGKTDAIIDGKNEIIIRNEKHIAVTAEIYDNEGRLIKTVLVPPMLDSNISKAIDLVKNPLSTVADFFNEGFMQNETKTGINSISLPAGSSIKYVRGTDTAIAVSAISTVLNAFQTTKMFDGILGSDKESAMKAFFYANAIKDTQLHADIATILKSPIGDQKKMSLLGEKIVAFYKKEFNKVVESKFLATQFDLGSEAVSKAVEQHIKAAEFIGALEKTGEVVSMISNLVADIKRGPILMTMQTIKSTSTSTTNNNPQTGAGATL
ncbi:MAG: two-partner secretion domain-containing protein [Desulfurivibrionaceae bacterium]